MGIDIGVTLGGWVSDTCYTCPVGDVAPQAGKLLDVTRECLEAGIAEVGPGKHFGWTVVSADKSRSAQYKHTIVVTSNGCEILTPWHLLMPQPAQLA